jgi:putative thioredoxin
VSDAHDKLDGVTRPRPSIGPALAGAVDLSGLKQRAQQKASAAGAAGPVASAGTGTTGTTEVTEANFESEVLIRSDEVPVVVLLWSPRSDACVELLETLSGLAAEDNGTWSLAAVNVDVTPKVAQIFGIEAVPTVVALAAGQPLSSFQGLQPPDQLRKWVDSLLSATAGKLSGPSGSGDAAQVDPELAQAREYFQTGDLDNAQTAYQAILEADPGSDEAKAVLRQVGFLKRAKAQVPDAVAIADAAPGDIEAAFAAADVQIVDGDVPAAFERLIALVRSTSGDERNRVRARLIELFELFDPADPDIVVARRNFANALY